MFKQWMVGLLFLSAGSSAMALGVTQGALPVPDQLPARTVVPILDVTIPLVGPPPESQYSGHATVIQLASASTAPALRSVSEADMAEKSLFKPRLFTANSIHKYLGIGSMVLATATVFVDKGDDDEGGGGESGGGLHQTLGTGAAALGVAAVATGLTFHYDDLKYSNGLRDPDNLHALLGILGTLGYLYAVDTAGDGGHAGAGILGAASMFYAIKLTW